MSSTPHYFCTSPRDVRLLYHTPHPFTLCATKICSKPRLPSRGDSLYWNHSHSLDTDWGGAQPFCNNFLNKEHPKRIFTFWHWISYVTFSGMPARPYQVVVRFDAEQVPKVAEGQRCVRLEAKVGVMMCRGQVASFTGMTTTTKNSRDIRKKTTTTQEYISLICMRQCEENQKSIQGISNRTMWTLFAF